MWIYVLGAVIGLFCYFLGFITGKAFASDKIDKMREEMQIEDEFDKLFNGDKK